MRKLPPNGTGQCGSSQTIRRGRSADRKWRIQQPAGNDRFYVRDGEVDKVHCGDGHDWVLADQFDQIDTDCERVRAARDLADQVDAGERDGEPSEDNDEGERRTTPPLA